MFKENDHKYIASLVVKVKHNNSDAFAQLYSMTYNKVYNYARHYLRDDFLAQDAVQEIYILALKNIHHLNDSELFIAWLNQISFRVCYDMSKKVNSSYGDITEPELLELVRDDRNSSNPEINAQQKAEVDSLRQAIDALPAHEKQCIILRYYNNMKIEDIVNMLGYSKSSVKRYLNSAKDHLALTLKRGEE